VSVYATVFNDLPVGPPYYQHQRGKWAAYLLEHGHMAPEWCLARISRGPRWWTLDDVLMEHARPDTIYIPELKLHIVQATIIPGVVEALGKDASRLRLRALPTLQELMPVAQRLTDATGHRHERLYRTGRYR
jgi:hypothetical protein